MGTSALAIKILPKKHVLLAALRYRNCSNNSANNPDEIWMMMMMMRLLLLNSKMRTANDAKI